MIHCWAKSKLAQLARQGVVTIMMRIMNAWGIYSIGYISLYQTGESAKTSNSIPVHS